MADLTVLTFPTQQFSSLHPSTESEARKSHQQWHPPNLTVRSVDHDRGEGPSGWVETSHDGGMNNASSSLLSPTSLPYTRPRRISSPAPVGRAISLEAIDESEENGQVVTDVEAADDESDLLNVRKPRLRALSTSATTVSRPNWSSESSWSNASGPGLGMTVTAPLPPLFRPHTFWRHTKRSAVTSPAYSPAAFVVRRAAFVAAGLVPTLPGQGQTNTSISYVDGPIADSSAMAVESRVFSARVVLVPEIAGDVPR